MSLYWEGYAIVQSMIRQFNLLLPYWLLGVMTGTILSTYAGNKIGSFVAEIAKSKLEIVVLFAAGALGVISPICMYGTIPLVAALGKKGVPQHILATFMMSSILLNPNLLILSFTLGSKIALLRLFVSLAAGITAGILVKLIYKGKKLFSFEGFEGQANCSSVNRTGIKKFAHNLNKTIVITGQYLLIGIFLTAIFDRYFPIKDIKVLLGSRSLVSVFLSASVGVPLYLCGGGTIPIIRSWLNAGMGAGSAVAFMISGPATKLNNLSAVKMVLGARNFIVYIVYSISFATLSGVLINLF